jgi:hypothetical protein
VRLSNGDPRKKALRGNDAWAGTLARITLEMTSMMLHGSGLRDHIGEDSFAKRTQAQWPNPKEFGVELMHDGWWGTTQANDSTLLTLNDFSCL